MLKSLYFYGLKCGCDFVCAGIVCNNVHTVYIMKSFYYYSVLKRGYDLVCVGLYSDSFFWYELIVVILGGYSGNGYNP